MKKWIGPIIIVIFALFLTLRNSPRIEGSFSVYNAIQWLKSHSYVQADPVTEPKPDNIPPDVKPLIVTTTSGEGIWIPTETYTPADTVSVELTEVTLIDGSHWVKVTIDSIEVKWHKLEHFQKPEELGRWSGGLEVAVLHGFDVGAFGAYRLGTLWGINAEAAVVIDVNTDLAESPDWIAFEGRLSIPVIGPFEGSLGLGIQATKEEIRFPHVSTGIGIRF